MTLDEFEANLSELIGRPTALRPFVCEGSPLDCDIFLVGFNPATALATDFWSFWQPGYGFDRKSWLDSYIAARKLPRPGRARQTAVSPTRVRIEAFVRGAGTLKVLEANIFSADSADMKTLEPARREIAPFEFLLRTIEPKVVVAHGKEAVAAMSTFKGPWRVIGAGHFSRFETKDSAYRLGRSAAAC